MIDLIWTWFKKAVPEPTDKNRAVQYGCHLEEIMEMFRAVDDGDLDGFLDSDWYKMYAKNVPVSNPEEFLDSLCDQIVTAVGVAYMMGYDIRGALSEVNRSNWSKFENGEPIFDENGKIKKGPNYSPPDLKAFL